MSLMASFLCCPFLPRDVLDEIWDFIELVSEGFPTDSCVCLFLSLLVLKGGIWDLTVLAPDHCLFFYLTYNYL